MSVDKYSHTELLASLFESSPDAILIVDIAGQPLYWNPKYLVLWGLNASDLANGAEVRIAKKLFRNLTGLDRLPEKYIVRVDPSKKQSSAEIFFHKDGRALQRTVFDLVLGGVKIGLVIQWRDAINDSALRKRVRHEHHLLIELMENIPDQIYFKDKDSKFIKINKSLADRFNLNDPAEAVGKSDFDYYNHKHAEKTRSEEIEIMKSGHGVFNYLHYEEWNDGSHTWNISTKLPLRDQEGDVIGVYGISHDITEQKEKEYTIWQQANIDELTLLPNRVLIEKLWGEIVESVPDGRLVGLLLLDLDNFKDVNDTLGHQAGDELLCLVAEAIKEQLAFGDILSRLGGDEFAIIIKYANSMSDIESYVKNILKAVSRQYNVANTNLFITTSIGIAVHPVDGVSLKDVLRSADQSLYRAKESGVNQFKFFAPEMSEATQRRMLLANELRMAIGGSQLFLVYQPIMDMHGGSVGKAEVLLRWKHPRLGFISPSEFIPIAESIGLINEIGDWVLDNALRQLSIWRGGGHSTLQLAINKSPVQLSRIDENSFPIDNILHELNLPGNAITLEITEGVLLHPTSRVASRLKYLSQLGLSLAIDDFGTGYSALSYLQKFKIDFLKIDKSFVSEIDSNQQRYALCEAIIRMAHSLGIIVIAEGVESKSEFDLLRSAGCNFVQGFYVAKPMTAERFSGWLLTYNKQVF